MTSTGDFDPHDPPRPSHQNPMVEYAQPPAGIGAVAFVQMLLAFMAAYSAIRTAVGGFWTTAALFTALAVLLGAVAWGFWTCRAWAWWLIAAIYYFLFFHFIVDATRWAGGQLQIKPVFQIVALGAEVALLYYINQPHVLRHIRFRHTPPSPWVRWSPVAVGLTFATLAALRSATVEAN